MSAVHPLQLCQRDGCGHAAASHVQSEGSIIDAAIGGGSAAMESCQVPRCGCAGFIEVRAASGWKCHNCERTSKFDEDHLPPGWRWFGLCDTLEGHFDELECPLLCSYCVAAIEEALKLRQEART